MTHSMRSVTERDHLESNELGGTRFDLLAPWLLFASLHVSHCSMPHQVDARTARRQSMLVIRSHDLPSLDHGDLLFLS